MPKSGNRFLWQCLLAIVVIHTVVASGAAYTWYEAGWPAYRPATTVHDIIPMCAMTRTLYDNGIPAVLLGLLTMTALIPRSFGRCVSRRALALICCACAAAVVIGVVNDIVLANVSPVDAAPAIVGANASSVTYIIDASWVLETLSEALLLACIVLMLVVDRQKGPHGAS